MTPAAPHHPSAPPPGQPSQAGQPEPGLHDPLVRPVRQPNDLHPDDDPPDTDRRLPSERDQSPDSQQRDLDPVGEQAYEDVRSGQRDTGRQPPMQDTYRRQQDDIPDTQPGDGLKPSA